jgi:hypothetical protein
MVEVHHVRRKRPTAVVTWNPPKVSEECERRFLAFFDPSDLLFPVTPVEGDVVRTLRACTRHYDLMIEHGFYLSQQATCLASGEYPRCADR